MSGSTMEGAYRSIEASRMGAEYARALVELAMACEADVAAADALDRERADAAKCHEKNSFYEDKTADCGDCCASIERAQQRRDRTNDEVGKARRRVMNIHEELLALTGAKGRI